MDTDVVVHGFSTNDYSMYGTNCEHLLMFTTEFMLEDMNARAKDSKKKKGHDGKRVSTLISPPQDFRRVCAIVDADMLPDTVRRVKLLKHSSDRPLGFYIRDGTSVRVTPYGLEKVPGIFISRLVPGGLAESTGLLAVNDEILEVNGIEVIGKSLDQVTDMMVANSQNLIITVKPASLPPATPRTLPQGSKRAKDKALPPNQATKGMSNLARSYGDLPSISASTPHKVHSPEMTHKRSNSEHPNPKKQGGLGDSLDSSMTSNGPTTSTPNKKEDENTVKRHSLSGAVDSS